MFSKCLGNILDIYVSYARYQLGYNLGYKLGDNFLNSCLPINKTIQHSDVNYAMLCYDFMGAASIALTAFSVGYYFSNKNNLLINKLNDLGKKLVPWIGNKIAPLSNCPLVYTMPYNHSPLDQVVEQKFIKLYQLFYAGCTAGALFTTFVIIPNLLPNNWRSFAFGATSVYLLGPIIKESLSWCYVNEKALDMIVAFNEKINFKCINIFQPFKTRDQQYNQSQPLGLSETRENRIKAVKFISHTVSALIVGVCAYQSISQK